MNSTISKQHIYEGTITFWDDSKGYGFICTKEPKSQRVLFRINVYLGQSRPKEGESVLFTAVKTDKRIEAKEVKPKFELQADNNIKIPQAYKPAKEESNFLDFLQSALMWVKFFASVLVAVVWFFYLLSVVPTLFYFYSTLSGILLLIYGLDKVAAVDGNWRASELKLHFFAIIGGWAGGLVGRYLFNHNTTKSAFVMIFWITVIINICVSFYIIYVDNTALFWLEHWRQKIISIYINMRY